MTVLKDNDNDDEDNTNHDPGHIINSTQLSLSLTCAGDKERTLLLNQLIQDLSSEDVKEELVDSTCSITVDIVKGYVWRGRNAHWQAETLIKTLCRLHSAKIQKSIIPTIIKTANKTSKLQPSCSNSRNSLNLLKILCILIECTFANDIDNAVISLLVGAQSKFLLSVVSCKTVKLKKKAYQPLFHMWNKLGINSLDVWIKSVLELSIESCEAPVMAACICSYLRTQNQNMEKVATLKEKILENFIKNYVSVKVRPNPSLIEACKFYLLELNNEDFKNILLPALQKAMLRNPELIIEAVGLILENLSLDLSAFALDIIKNIAANLHSKEEIVRTDAANTCKKLAEKCSESTHLITVTKFIFDVLNGSNGKITLPEHKASLLLGIGNFSYNKANQENYTSCLTEIAKLFFKVLETESHEKTLCYCLDVFMMWGKNLTGDLPDSFIETLKKNYGLKTSSQLVKINYLRWLSQCLTKSSVSSKNVEALNSFLVKIVEKAVQQPLQILVVSEGLCAAFIMLKIDSKNEIPSKTPILWNALLPSEKQVFLLDKFLTTAPDNVLISAANTCCILIEKYRNEIDSKSSHFLKGLIICSLSTSSAVRENANNNIKAILDSTKSATLARSFIVLLAGQIDMVKNSNMTKSDTEAVEFNGKIVVQSISAILDFNDYSEEDRQLISVDALLAAHHPLVVAENPTLWLKIVRHFKLQPKTLIGLSANNIRNKYIAGFERNQSYCNVVSTIVAQHSEVILPNLISLISETLDDPEMLKVTCDEYFTYLTPEGELFDKSVIPGNDDNSEINMKRESKAYSYKDQLEELQLRRELEERRGKEGKNKAPKELTQKQKEAIKLQMAKESLIKTKLAKLEERLDCVEKLLLSAGEGNPSALGKYCHQFLSRLLYALKSPLAATRLSALFLQLCAVFWPSNMNVLGKTVAHITLRLYKPQCNLDSEWEKEKIDDAVPRIIELLYFRTARMKLVTDPEQAVDVYKYFLTAPAFCYCFYLLKQSLTSPMFKFNEKMLSEGINFISHHSKLRGNPTMKVDLYHPSLLPTEHMLQLLIDLIGISTGRIQSQSCAALIDVATTISGSDNCGHASRQDIDCLLSGLQNPSEIVRDACLRGLMCLVKVFPNHKEDTQQTLSLTKRLWIAKFDVSEENRVLAATLWETSGLEMTIHLVDDVMEEVCHPVEAIQKSVANALAALLEMERMLIKPTIDGLLTVYNKKLDMIPPKVDEFGHIIEHPIDEWGGRRGVGLALTALAPLLEPDSVGLVVNFFVSSGLGDRAEEVRKEMFSAAMAVVDLHGKDTISDQLPVFQEFLDKAPKTGSFDVIRQAVVILIGSLAKHLSPEDPRIKPITIRLITALSTPSQQVQEAVGNCLPHLITSPVLRDDTTDIVNRLMTKLLKGEKYGDRKGAAYGLAGIVKGLGILALKQLDIMTRLTDAIQDKKNFKHREGALFAFEMLCTKLGRLFEPYIVHVLPHLLLCFGDSSQYVRTATDDTAKVIMSKLSAHGVKLVLPSLLAALEDDSWRTKTGSIELLGAMAYCAPKQLSSCLPSIVPKLIEVLSDSHVKVQEAGAEALKVIGSVIRNPEIQAIVPPLLEALQDPSNKTSACLQTLLDTQFVHFIDAPSLALIMPVVQRAFMDRSTETRKMAAQIIGNMYSLTDQKDLMPYLPNIIPGLKTSLLDPVPEVRSVSARALGAMVRGMGESSFEDLLPWLMQTLTSETSSVDRSGAAQGLSEVVAGLGVEKLHKLMPDIIATSERTDIAPHVKDGYIMMFIYMPGAFTDEFTPYIGQIINPILKALADENEYVRDTALKAGQRIVNLYADTAITLLLPELEKGLFDDDWRIRYSSVQLLGDLLYRISGVSGKMSTETASEDDNFGTEQSHSAIMVALGHERRNRVLAGLYMGRSDVALMVRQAALHVWKVVVTNTPRTLREILPTLFGLLLGCLASTSFDKRQVAARTLGDLVRKLGERVLPEIIPILERGLQSDRPDQRQGVCIGLSEIMASTSKDMVLTFVNSLVPTVRRALCDPLPEVRCAAAKTFDSLHTTVGVRALDDILPAMLNGLNDPDPDVAEATLDGLRQVMAIKSRVVLPYLVPQLSAPPVNTKALSILASVAGDALTKYLHKILPALLNALCAAQGTPSEARELEYCQGVVLSVSDEAGVRAVMDALLEGSRSTIASQRRAAATLLAAFCSHTRADYTHYIPQLLRGLIHLFADTENDVLLMAWEALQAVTKSMDAEQQIQHVSDIRQAVRFAVSDLKGAELLPGFCLPKGITPILPLFRESILNGLPEDKEAAALMLGEVIKLTSATALQPSVVHITGPLIRILGDRFNASVKAAVLETLALLLAKVGVMLKQFLPQLQTTFLKALNDPNRQVRIKAGYALSQLVIIHTRADPLFIEIHNGIKNSEDLAVKETMLQALRSIMSCGGEKMTESLSSSILTTLVMPSLLGHSEDPPRSAIGGCLGALLPCLASAAQETALQNHILCEDNADWTVKHGRSCALFVTLKEHAEIVFVDQHKDKLCKTLLGYLTSDKVQIVGNGIRGIGYLMRYLQCNGIQIPPPLLTPFLRTMNHTNNEVKKLLAQVCTMLGKTIPSEKMAPELLKLLLPTLVNGTKEKNSYVKSNSEIALIAVLRLRKGDEVQQQYLKLLEVGARESLNDVVNKVLKKALNQPECKEEELDSTLIT